MLRRAFLTSVLAAGLLSVPLVNAQAEAGEVRIFAAASLKNAFDSVAAKWKAKTGDDVVMTFASSSAVARQVEAGAPADLFVSADLKWMDYLQSKGLIKPDTRENLLGNALVLIEGIDSKKTYDLKKGFDLAGALGDGRLAVGQTQSVPAGRYAKEALTSLGMWDSVKSKLAEAENVRAALLLVSRGEAPLGIVYMTDSKIDTGVRVAATFPEGSHKPIIYPIAQVKASNNPLAADFEKYLRTKEATDIFLKQGFTVLSHSQ